MNAPTPFAATPSSACSSGCLAAAFWFHPLIHLANRLLDRAREEICDNYRPTHTATLATIRVPSWRLLNPFRLLACGRLAPVPLPTGLEP